MKTADVKRRGMGLIRGVLANLAAFLDIRQFSSAQAGPAMQAATTSDANTTTFDVGFAQSAAQAGTEAFLAGLAEDVKDAFDTATDPRTGAGWEPRKDEEPHPLLVKTGRLRAAAVAAVQAAGIVGGGVQVDLTDPAYGFFHHLGTAHMPARPFFGPSPATLATATGEVMLVVENLLGNWR